MLQGGAQLTVRLYGRSEGRDRKLGDGSHEVCFRGDCGQRRQCGVHAKDHHTQTSRPVPALGVWNMFAGNLPSTGRES